MSNNVSAPVDALAVFGTPEFRRDPYPFLKWLRDNDPVHRTSKGYYLVSRHADAEWVLRDPDQVFRTPDRDRLAEQFPEAVGYRAVELLLTSLPSLNAPVHTRIRKLVAQEFTPRRVSGLHEHIGLLADRHLDRLSSDEVVDLHAEFTRPFTLDVISDLLGVPEDVRGDLEPDASELASALGSGSKSLLDKADVHTARLERAFRDLIESSPPGTLISDLVRRRDEPGSDALSDEELVAMMWILWNVGFEGTAAAIEHGVRLLAANPDQGHWLRNGFDDATAFANEVLRHTGPQIFLGVSQIATRDIVLGGKVIPVGAQVRPVLAAANRDPDVFADPDRFDPSRDTSASLVFGQGMHHCLGVFLARAEIAIALSRLHQRFPALAMAGEPTWADTFTMRMPSRFPVVVVP
ncbi:cytochrome P450 [Lentzea sp. NPDC051838]|uniref:cytochrome P450 n=1 Tax=Lentzea sp. NPDC051838 TaxID=3154849 RepID=UPI00342552A5